MSSESGSFNNWLKSFTNAQRQWLDKKTLCISVLLLAFALFGDSILPLIKKSLHVGVEIIESVMEHFLESAFQVTPRQAEIIVFWIDVLIVGFILWRVLWRMYQWLLRICVINMEKWRNKGKREKIITLLWASLILVAAIKIALLLFM